MAPGSVPPELLAAAVLRKADVRAAPMMMAPRPPMVHCLEIFMPVPFAA
jgi:hypothetical protein